MRLVEAGGRHVVVHRRDREVGAPHAAAREAQPVERLRRRHLVHEVEIDVEEIGLALGVMDDVVRPDLLGQASGMAVIAPRLIW